MENKENVINRVEKNRSRGDNWTQEEKDIFLELMRKSATIIENKKTDTNTNKEKNLEWLKVQSKLKELTGKPRDIAQLKGFWRRTKIAAKKSIAEHRRALQATGGGQRPPSPPPDDLKVVNLCPTDFVVEENIYDSDANCQITGQGESMIVDIDSEAHNSTLYDIEVNEEISNDKEGVVEIITVANVHNSEEIYNKTEGVVEVITLADVHNTEIDNKPRLKTNVMKTEVPKFQNIEKKTKEKEKYEKNNTSKAALIGSSIELKKRAMLLMEEEYELKIKYQKQEIAHQQLRHKLEIDLLMLEKEKKLLEIQALKKTL